MLNIDEFIKKYTGVKVGTTKDNFGECTGLIHKWRENLGLTIFWGHAKYLYANAPSSEYTKIKNASGIYPRAGDIIVWTSVMGGGYGHTAIAISSSVKEDSVTVFEQNNPIGNAPRTYTYKNWNGIYGWLRPNVAEEVSDFLNEDISTEVEGKYELKKIKRYNKNWTYNDLVRDWVGLTEELSELDTRMKQERLDYEEGSKSLEATISGLKTKVGELEGTLKTEKQKYTDLMSRYDRIMGKIAECETLCQSKDKEIATLQETLTTIPSDSELSIKLSICEGKKLELLTKNFDDWLKNQNLKTKLVFILDILRSVIH
jgi:hypothetical protein